MTRNFYLLIATAVVGGIIVSGWFYYRYHRDYFRQENQEKLTAIVNLKVKDIAYWLNKRLGNANVFYNNEAFANLVRASYEKEGANKEQLNDLTGWLQRVQNSHDYQRIFLLDSRGEIRLALPTRPGKICHEVTQRTTDALITNQIVWVDYFHSESDDNFCLAYVIPIFSENNGLLPLGTLILQVDLNNFLNPLVEHRLMTSYNIETMLIRREGDHVDVLNALPQPKQAAPRRLSLNQNSPQLAVKAALVGQGMVEGLNEHGIPVLAAVRTIPGTSWILVVSREKGKITAQLQRAMWFGVLLLVSSLIATITGIGYLWRKQRYQHLQAKYEQIQAQATLNHRFRTMVDNDWGVTLLVNSAGAIDYISESIRRILGYSPEGVVRLSLTELIHPDDLTRCAEFWNTLLKNSNCYQTVEAKIRHQNGNWTWMEMTGINRTNEPNIKAIVINARDISERKMMEERFHRLNRTLTVISEINHIIVNISDSQLLFNEACRIVVEKGGLRLAWIDLIDPKSQAFTPHAVAGMTKDELQQSGLIGGSDAGNPFVAVGHTGEFIIRGNIEDHPARTPWREAALHLGCHAAAAFPLKVAGKTYAIFNFYAREPNFFDGKEVALLNELASDVALAMDLQMRGIARREVEKLQRLTQFVVDHAADAIFLLAADGRIVNANEAAEHCLGYSHVELCRLVIADIDPRFTTANWASHWHELREQNALTFESQLRAQDGRLIPVEVTANYVNFDEQEYDCLFARDITERKEAEAKLKLRDAAIEAAANAIVITDRDGFIQWVNFAFSKLTGYSREEALGRNPRELVKSGHHSPEFYQNLWNSIQDGQVWSGEMVNRRKDGNLYSEDMTITPVSDQQGKITHFIAIKQDITARKKAEERIHQQTTLLDLANDAALVCDLDGQMLYWNRGAGDLFEWTTDEAVGGKIQALIFASEHDFQNLMDRLLADEYYRGEMSLHTKSGTHLIVNASLTLLKDANNHPNRIFFIGNDISEKKKQEKLLLRSQRLESVGRLSSGIAHDLNNILSPIIMGTQLLKKTIPDPKAIKMLDAMESSARRGGAIIKQLLTFGRGMEGKMAPVQLKSLLKDMESIIKETFPKDIIFERDIPTDLSPVQGDVTQLHQVLMNLCVNARDAMPQGGTLTLKLEMFTVDKVFSQMQEEIKPGRYVILSVSDTGTGITPECLDKIFDPFFTTKEIGRGTGLGLSTVLGIVKSHLGFIQIDTKVGQGTKFKVYLPVSTQSLDEETMSDDLWPQGHGDLILLVDDEENVRQMLRQMLEENGYRVIEAKNGAEALIQYGQHQEDVRAMITDMVMPIMNGPTLIEALHHINSNLIIIIISGYESENQLRGLPKVKSHARLHKPFSVSSLLTTLDQILHPQPT